MQMQCVIKVADICDTKSWWDEKQFDRILLDVPCSASGVIRRNPDIKIHRLATDMAPLVETQRAILEKAWSLLKPGGKLVYATCSIFKEENELQLESFLKNNDAEKLEMPQAIHDQLSSRATIGYQIFPGEAQMDGFYLCGLQKPQ